MAERISSGRRRWVYVGGIVLLMAAMYPLQHSIEKSRAHHGFTINPLQDLPPGEFFGTVLLGGFRAIAVDFIWLEANKAERNQDWHRYRLLSELIASLQPRFEEVWIFNAWNMAYNLSVAATTDREAWEWVKRGLEFGKKGFRRNPDSWKIAWNIGQHYFHKCGEIRADRTRKYQKWLFEETGRTNWQHAVYWFEKASEVGGDRANPHWLGMISAAYRKIAYEAEEKGDLRAMEENRLKAIAWLQTISRRYPSREKFRQYAQREIKDLRSRLKAHKQEARARQLGDENKIAEEFDLLEEAARYWMEAFKGNPYIGEQTRHLETIAARLEEMIPVADPPLEARAELLQLDIWLRLTGSPEYSDSYIEKCRQLDAQYTARLREAAAAGNEGKIVANLDSMLRLRRMLYGKDPLSEKQAASIRELADICEKLEGQVGGKNRDFVGAAARRAWTDLLSFGHKELAQPGIKRLKARIEAIEKQIGQSGDEESEILRLQALDLLLVFHREDIEREWAEQRLRQMGEYYTGVIIAALGRKDEDAAGHHYKRATAIWERIKQLHPGDHQAEDNLNRIHEAYKMIFYSTSVQ